MLLNPISKFGVLQGVVSQITPTPTPTMFLSPTPTRTLRPTPTQTPSNSPTPPITPSTTPPSSPTPTVTPTESGIGYFGRDESKNYNTPTPTPVDTGNDLASFYSKWDYYKNPFNGLGIPYYKFMDTETNNIPPGSGKGFGKWMVKPGSQLPTSPTEFYNGNIAFIVDPTNLLWDYNGQGQQVTKWTGSSPAFLLENRSTFQNGITTSEVMREILAPIGPVTNFNGKSVFAYFKIGLWHKNNSGNYASETGFKVLDKDFNTLVKFGSKFWQPTGFLFMLGFNDNYQPSPGQAPFFPTNTDMTLEVFIVSDRVAIIGPYSNTFIRQDLWKDAKYISFFNTGGGAFGRDFFFNDFRANFYLPPPALTPTPTPTPTVTPITFSNFLINSGSNPSCAKKDDLLWCDMIEQNNDGLFFNNDSSPSGIKRSATVYYNNYARGEIYFNTSRQNTPFKYVPEVDHPGALPAGTVFYGSFSLQNQGQQYYLFYGPQITPTPTPTPTITPKSDPGYLYSLTTSAGNFSPIILSHTTVSPEGSVYLTNDLALAADSANATIFYDDNGLNSPNFINNGYPVNTIIYLNNEVVAIITTYNSYPYFGIMPRPLLPSNSYFPSKNITSSFALKLPNRDRLFHAKFDGGDYYFMDTPTPTPTPSITPSITPTISLTPSVTPVYEYWNVYIETLTQNQLFTIIIEGLGVNLFVDWGDGTFIYIIEEGNVQKIFSNPGIYTIKIRGSFLSNGNIKLGLSNEEKRLVFSTSSIPYIPGLTRFSDTFNNTKLKSIPSDLFINNSNIISFDDCFNGCKLLSSIPSNLFSNNPSVTSFSSCFNGCSSLSSIPQDLFFFNNQSQVFDYCFANCLNIKSIPSNLFNLNAAAKSFLGCFGNSGLSSIPVDLFNNCNLVEDFSYCFAKNMLSGNDLSIQIDSNLFSNCKEVLNFEGLFSDNVKLTNVPANLFKENLKVDNFNLVFRNCPLSDTSYSSLLSSLSSYNLNLRKNNVIFDANISYYNSAGEEAKNSIISTKNWSFFDAGLLPTPTPTPTNTPTVTPTPTNV